MFGLFKDLATIALAPVVIVAEVVKPVASAARIVTKPVADVAKEVTEVVKDIVK